MFFILIFLPKAISFHIWRLKCVCIFILFTKKVGQSVQIFGLYGFVKSDLYEMAFIELNSSSPNIFSLIHMSFENITDKSLSRSKNLKRSCENERDFLCSKFIFNRFTGLAQQCPI